MYFHRWVDSDVILYYTRADADMLEVYYVTECDAINLRMLANCCLWNYTPVAMHTNNLGMRNGQISVIQFQIIPPTWRSVITMTSIHFMYTFAEIKMTNMTMTVIVLHSFIFICQTYHWGTFHVKLLLA